MLVDEADVTCLAGDGGRGCCSFRRERFVPKGGPDGGDGGSGGSIYFVCDSSLNDLNYFRFNPRHKAERGRHGEGSLRHGRNGKDVFIGVPPGTQVFRDGEMIWESRLGSDPFCVARGGRGGFGNAHFKSPTRRAPRYAEAGHAGDECRVKLHLKLIADCGIVGFPNAGKSTLVSSVSAARPKIADYPFTTLEPHLGVIHGKDYATMILADIPGLIPGAHEGHGLGNRFLKHIMRTKVLLFLIDVSESSGRKPMDDYEALIQEVGCFEATLLNRPAVIAASKIDILHDRRRLDGFSRAMRKHGKKVFPISAVTGDGVKPLVNALFKLVASARADSITELEEVS